MHTYSVVFLKPIFIFSEIITDLEVSSIFGEILMKTPSLVQAISVFFSHLIVMIMLLIGNFHFSKNLISIIVLRYALLTFSHRGGGL